MKNYQKLGGCALALLIATGIFSGCAGSTGGGEQAVSQSVASGQSGSAVLAEGQTQYAGKVTAITGNQVELALGTVEGGQPQNRPEHSEDASMAGSAPAQGEPPMGSRPEKGDSSGSGTESGAMQPPSDGGGQSKEVSITLTGETKTVLIPVGLSLSGSGMGGGKGEGGEMPGKDTKQPAAGGGAASSGAKQGGGTQAAAKSSSGKDYSSITTGMILQITEQTGTDGTQQIVGVRVLSK